MFLSSASAYFFATIAAGTWVDIGCLLVVGGMAYFNAAKGFSNTLAVLLGLLIASHAGYWLYPTFYKLVGTSSFAKDHIILAAILPYILAVFTGLALFIVIRLCFRKFFKLLVEQPADKFLGAISGIAKGMLIILLVFSCISLLPENTSAHRVFCRESVTGRAAVPVLQNVLSQSYPKDKLNKVREELGSKKRRPSKSGNAGK